MAVLAAIPALLAAAGSAATAAAGSGAIIAGAGSGLAGAAGTGAAVAAGSTAAGLAGTSITLSQIGLWSGVASGLLGGVSAFMQGRYQSQVARNNAQIAEANRVNALKAGQNAESMERIKTSQLVGSMEAAQGANNVDVGFGSIARSRSSARSTGELDALTIRYNAAREAYGFGAEAANFGAESKLDTSQANQGLLSGALSGFSSFIGGASSIINKQLQYQQAGIPGY